MDLRERFLALARGHGADVHTLVHIGEMLALLPHADETVLAAVWFHDAFYGGDTNEQRSAELSRHALV